MAKYTPQDIIRMVRENDIRFLRLQFTDIFGAMKSVTVTASQVEKALKNDCRFDGSSIEGFTRIEESDMCLYPDPDSFCILPWSEQGQVARLICDVYTTDGRPFEGNPRYVLERVLERAREMGYEFYVGPELEFFLFHTDDTGKATTRTYDEGGGYFDPESFRRGGEIASREMCVVLEDMGFEIEASHHEVARGQHEIDFSTTRRWSRRITSSPLRRSSRPLRSATACMLPSCPSRSTALRAPACTSTCRCSMTARMCSMTKKGSLRPERDGLSLYRGCDGARAFYGRRDQSARQPYKRLVPGHEAPIYICWSAKNRSPLIRHPGRARQGQPASSCATPTRRPTPIWCFALVLEAGCAALRKSLIPCDPVNQNVYQMSRRSARSAA